MSISKNLIILVVLSCCAFSIFGQEGYPGCNNPKVISMPLREDLALKETNEIFYQLEDKYTYWYKLEVANDCELSYQLSAISAEDGYQILIYKLNGSNFCNSLLQKKESPIETRSKGTISVKQGEHYYVSIIHLNGYGCGHLLTLKTGDKTVIMKAIQHECVEEAIETMAANEGSEEVETSITLAEEKVNEKKYIKGVVVNSSTQQSIDALVVFFDVNGKPYQKIKAKADSGFVMLEPEANQLILFIQKFGYESYLDTIQIATNPLRIEIDPIKVGEKIIMHKIYFHPNTYVLKEESKKELIQLNKFMLENMKYSFEIQGHTNGNKIIKKNKRYEHLGEEWNFKGTAKKLSKMRAEKIKAYLVENGVMDARLQTVGFGGDRMIIKKPKNMKQAIQNIRVEVIVVQ